MNQVTNLVQWKNLTQEQKDGFDFENFKYEVQRLTNGVDFYTSIVSMNGEANYEKVYRLVIEPDKWYTGFINGELVTCLGSCFDGLNPETLRPARPDEIPQPEKTLEEKIQEEWPDKEVVMFGWSSANIWGWTTGNKTEHIKAQSMKGFAGYVYDFEEGYKINSRPIWPNTTMQPIAVLFEGEASK